MKRPNSTKLLPIPVRFVDRIYQRPERERRILLGKSKATPKLIKLEDEFRRLADGLVWLHVERVLDMAVKHNAPIWDAYRLLIKSGYG